MFTFKLIYIICVFINLFLLRGINNLSKKYKEPTSLSLSDGIIISIFSFFLTLLLIIIYVDYYKKVYKNKWLKFEKMKNSILIKIKKTKIYLIIYKNYYKLNKWFLNQ